LENEQERESSFLLPPIQSDDRERWETSTEGEKLTTWQELIEIFQIAIPTAMGNLSEFLPITFAMGMVGQMNVGGNGLQLDALAMANSYWNMTGLAVQYGLNSAMCVSTDKCTCHAYTYSWEKWYQYTCIFQTHTDTNYVCNIYICET
jgi:hypothetical protein